MDPPLPAKPVPKPVQNTASSSGGTLALPTFSPNKPRKSTQAFLSLPLDKRNNAFGELSLAGRAKLGLELLAMAEHDAYRTSGRFLCKRCHTKDGLHVLFESLGVRKALVPKHAVVCNQLPKCDSMDNATCCGHELHPEFEERKVQQKERARQVKAKQKAKEKKDKVTLIFASIQNLILFYIHSTSALQGPL